MNALAGLLALYIAGAAMGESTGTRADIAMVTTTIFSMAAAVLSGFCALGSFVLAKRIRREARLDERLVFGPLEHPASVTNDSHRVAVVCCPVFNKAVRKAYINRVHAFDSAGEKIDITWSSQIDAEGSPEEPYGLIGVVDTSSLYVRRNDREIIVDMRLVVCHSFTESSPTEIIYEQFK